MTETMTRSLMERILWARLAAKIRKKRGEKPQDWILELACTPIPGERPESSDPETW